MKILNKIEIKQLATLNNKLKKIEEQIYSICIEENQIALEKILRKENGILDYELEVHYFFYRETFIKKANEEDTEQLLANWVDNIKPVLLKDKRWGIHDDNCHNTTSIWQKNKDLNSQKHCSLLHSLYDHFNLEWHNIFQIDRVYFDIVIHYEYSSAIKYEGS